MQQHPIPQNVMSVEFQLVGNLTLRQFAYLAVGGMIVFTLSLLPINDFIKWSLILVIGSFSAGLAWLPINDISLDRWVVAFFRAINSPTKRIWRKEIKELPIFARDYAQNLLNQNRTLPTADRTKLEEYLATLRASQPKSDLDLAEQAYLESLPFEEGGPPQPALPILGPQPAASLAEEVLPPTPAKAELETTPEPRVVEEDLTKPTPLQPTVKPVITVHMPDKNIYVKKVSTTTVNRQLHSLSSLEGTIVLPVRGEKTFDISEDLKRRLYPEEIAVTPPPPPPVEEVKPAVVTPPQVEIPQPAPAQPTPPDLLIKQPVPNQPDNRPQTDVLEMEKKLAAEAAATREKLQKKPAPPQASTPTVPPPKNEVVIQPKQEPKPEPAKVSVPDRSQDKVNLPSSPPKVASQTSGTVVNPSPAVGKMAPPAANVPNVVVGLVRDQSGLLLVEVVIIVKDPDGEPVRALKTNKVGQFAISTPLPNGRYTIDLEKDGYKFDTIAVDLEGQIFTPIEIKAK